MGRDLDLFVHPERISSQLICPICTLVLENPVQTSSEHLFCEAELLEWLSRSTLCPVTNSELDPNYVKKPSRIIINMLAELEMFCYNKKEGCTWTGQSEHIDSHMKECKFISREELLKEIDDKNTEITSLNESVDSLTMKITEVIHENAMLKSKLQDYEKKLRIYDAFLVDRPNVTKSDAIAKSPRKIRSNENIQLHEDRKGFDDLAKLTKLRNLTSLKADSKSDNYDRGQK